ncbi:hypothetical protein [Desulfobacula sp.]|uniref:hypothetical protein n=1 Tax=Desulfobacula sp. TaxID=2593537 RepID=UPI001ED1E9A1|nr:hypothetical protein [Desulfobacula sp.]
MDRLNLTELIREIEYLAERLIYADAFKKSGDLQKYELEIEPRMQWKRTSGYNH